MHSDLILLIIHYIRMSQPEAEKPQLPQKQEDHQKQEEDGGSASEHQDADFSQFEQFQDVPNSTQQKEKSNQFEDQAQKQLTKQQQHYQHQETFQEQHVPTQYKQSQQEANNQYEDQQPASQALQQPAHSLQNQHQNPPQVVPQQEKEQHLIKQNLPNSNQDKIPSNIKSQSVEQPSKIVIEQVRSQIIVHQAQNQRLASTYALFTKYNAQYKKTVGSYKLVLKNVRSELINRQNYKKQLRSTLIQYFETDIALNKSFYEKSYKIQKQQQSSASMNKLANIKQELRQGFEGLFNVRKSLADQMRKLQGYINSYTIKSLNEVFQTYQRLMNSEERRQSETVDQYFDAQKSLQKILITIEKLLKKGIKGERGKEDIFIWIVKFINEEKDYRQSLIKYGKTLIELRKTYIAGEKQLFTDLQRIINQFKLQSRKVYASKKDDFATIDDYLPEIEKLSAFEYLCTITDIDYIKSVLELQNRKEFTRFTDDHFVNYLELPFFDHIVGNKKDLFKGAINKCFALLKNNEQLVHTISGNLVQFNKETDQSRQKYLIKNLSVRLIGEGAIEFDELIRGIIFSENRTARFKLKDNDSAEQLISYLNEKREIETK